MSNGATGATRVFRLGTRGSKLARWQADWVAAELAKLGHAVEIIEIRTQGDAQQRVSLAEVSQATGTQGLFTKELQRALLAGEVDLAVHSMKDLPTEPVAGLVVAATPPREMANDVLVGPFDAITELPQGARIGTGSLRRRAQLLSLRPDLVIEDLRGNVDTRLRKLAEGQHDAILLAAAGLKRLGLAQDQATPLPFDQLIPAPAQGCLAIECRSDDAATLAALAPLDLQETRAAITAERTAMRRLEGGCLAALGAHAEVAGDRLRLIAVVLSEDGAKRLDHSAEGSIDQAESLGLAVAEELLAQGARELLRPRD